MFSEQSTLSKTCVRHRDIRAISGSSWYVVFKMNGRALTCIMCSSTKAFTKEVQSCLFVMYSSLSDTGLFTLALCVLRFFQILWKWRNPKTVCSFNIPDYSACCFYRKCWIPAILTFPPLLMNSWPFCECPFHTQSRYIIPCYQWTFSPVQCSNRLFFIIPQISQSFFLSLSFQLVWN